MVSRVVLIDGTRPDELHDSTRWDDAQNTVELAPLLVTSWGFISRTGRPDDCDDGEHLCKEQ